MAEFGMPKDYSDVKPPVQVPDRVYRLRSAKPAYASPTRDQQGENIVLEMVTFGEDNDDLNGIAVRYWINLPKLPEDNEKKTARGQSFTDFKMDMAAKTVEAIGGKVEGNNLIIPDAWTCKAMLKTEKSDRGEFLGIDGDLMPDRGPREMG